MLEICYAERASDGTLLKTKRITVLEIMQHPDSSASCLFLYGTKPPTSHPWTSIIWVRLAAIRPRRSRKGGAQ